MHDEKNLNFAMQNRKEIFLFRLNEGWEIEEIFNL